MCFWISATKWKQVYILDRIKEAIIWEWNCIHRASEQLNLPFPVEDSKELWVNDQPILLSVLVEDFIQLVLTHPDVEDLLYGVFKISLRQEAKIVRIRGSKFKKNGDFHFKMVLTKRRTL